MKRKARCQHLQNALVVGSNSDVHVTQSTVASDSGPCFPADSRQRTFHGQCSFTQPARSRAGSPVPAQLVQLRPTLALSFGELEWQPHPLEKQRAEQHGLHLKLELSWGSVEDGTRTWTGVRPEMGLISSRQHHGLPVMVLGRGRRMMLPAVEPLSRLCHLGNWWSCTCLQCFPTRSADESAAIQVTSCSLKLGKATLGLSCELCDDVVRHLWESLRNHVESVRP